MPTWWSRWLAGKWLWRVQVSGRNSGLQMLTTANSFNDQPKGEQLHWEVDNPWWLPAWQGRSASSRRPMT